MSITATKCGNELRSSGRVRSYGSTNGTRRVTLVGNPVRKGPGSVYDNWNIYVVICDTENGERGIEVQYLPNGTNAGYM
jgi:hypothetical protein